MSADPHSSCTEARCAGHSRTSSEAQTVKIPYFDVHRDASPEMSASNFSQSYSDHGWEEIEKQSNGASEELCREVRCIETEEMSSRVESDCHSFENGHGEAIESPSTPFENIRVFRSSSMENDCAMKEETQPESLKEEKEPLPPPLKEEREVSFMKSVDFPSLSSHELDKDSSMARFFKLTKSRSCRARIAGSTSPWFKMLEFSESTSSMGSERRYMDSEKKPSPLNYSPFVRYLSRKDSHFSPDNTFDIEIDSQAEKLPTATSCTAEMKENTEQPTEDVHFKNQVSYIPVEILHNCS